MAKMTVSGFEAFSKKLGKLAVGETTKVLTEGVYLGAGETAAAVKATISALPSEKGSWPFYKKTIVGLSETQKQGLLHGVGIAKIESDGASVNTKIGFDGYNDHVTKHYPKGQPNALVARSLESGSSIGAKHPIIRPTVNKVRRIVEKKMADKVKNEIEKAMK